MDMNKINQHLLSGNIDTRHIFPHLDRLKNVPFNFKVDFGLSKLPEEAGILLIRGARQYGKSTWLESQMYQTIQQFGPGTAFYLNGDKLPDANTLEQEILLLIQLFHPKSKVKRLFIDEITAVGRWEYCLKRMVDSGQLDNVLLVTTGSKAMDIRRGAERLPGRKGKLARTKYLFTPISYREFHRVCHATLKEKTLVAYLISGGSPIACNEIAMTGMIPEYVIELVRDWIEGEIVASGRNRSAILNIQNTVHRFAGCVVGQSKLARESGIANNTLASAYIEILQDLACVVPAYPWDPERGIIILRKPCKYHYTNLLAAIAYGKANIRSPEEFLALPEQAQDTWYEWLVAQELLRRNAIKGDSMLEPLMFWQSKTNEVDFVTNEEVYFEVKRGKCSIFDFKWFTQSHPGKQLIVINQERFDSQNIKGVTLEDFLLFDASLI